MIAYFQAGSWAEWFSSLSAEIQRTVLQSIDGLIKSIFARLPFLLAGLIVLVLFWLLSKIFRAAFMAGTRRTKIDERLRILTSRMIVGVVITLGVFTALTVVVPSFDLGSLIAGLGFTSFVIGFATKDILNNFLSGILILWQQPFQIGDHLFVGNNQGKVEYIGVRATSLRKDDGELILIPNGDMYSSALTIRGAGSKRRMNLKYSIGYDENIEQAKSLTYDALLSCEGVVQDPKPRVLVSDVTAEGVIVTVNFWINTNESRPLQVFDAAAVAVVSALNEADIELYPPGSMIVQQPNDRHPAEVEIEKKKEEF